MKRIIVANWKMNLNLAEAVALGQQAARTSESYSMLDVIIAPSALWLVPLAEALRMHPKNFHIASQSVSSWSEGAYTGDIAAKQLKGVVTHSLVGHSERRKYHHESGEVISEQIKQLLAQGITPIVCFGEMSQSNQGPFSPQVTVDLGKDLSGLTNEQVSQCIFAYEPLWAIGTGNPATPQYVQKAAEHVRKWMQEKFNQEMRLLYGGSVTEDNAAELGKIKEIDGLLVGGASLSAKRFGQICEHFSVSV